VEGTNEAWRVVGLGRYEGHRGGLETGEKVHLGYKGMGRKDPPSGPIAGGRKRKEERRKISSERARTLGRTKPSEGLVFVGHMDDGRKRGRQRIRLNMECPKKGETEGIPSVAGKKKQATRRYERVENREGGEAEGSVIKGE